MENADVLCLSLYVVSLFGLCIKTPLSSSLLPIAFFLLFCFFLKTLTSKQTTKHTHYKFCVCVCVCSAWILENRGAGTVRAMNMNHKTIIWKTTLIMTPQNALTSAHFASVDSLTLKHLVAIWTFIAKTEPKPNIAIFFIPLLPIPTTNFSLLFQLNPLLLITLRPPLTGCTSTPPPLTSLFTHRSHPPPLSIKNFSELISVFKLTKTEVSGKMKKSIWSFDLAMNIADPFMNLWWWRTGHPYEWGVFFFSSFCVQRWNKQGGIWVFDKKIKLY